MAGLEELKKKLQPLLFDDTDKGGVSTRVPFLEDTCDSYVVKYTLSFFLLCMQTKLGCLCQTPSALDRGCCFLMELVQVV